jgi:hypothetical protein
MGIGVMGVALKVGVHVAIPVYFYIYWGSRSGLQFLKLSQLACIYVDLILMYILNSHTSSFITSCNII